MHVARISAAAALIVAGCAAPPPTTLDGRISLPDAQHLLVQGETNLPAQAQIQVSVVAAKDPAVLAQSRPQVRDGRFQALLTLPNAFPAGRYTLRMTFSPAAFDRSRGKVRTIVGRNGEHLRGPLVRQEGDIAIVQRDLPFLWPLKK